MRPRCRAFSQAAKWTLTRFETHQGPGAYLRDAVTKACRPGRDGRTDAKQVAAVAEQYLKAGDSVGIGYRVFILNRLAHAGGLRGDFWRRAGVALAPSVAEMPGDLLGLAANAFAAAGETPRSLTEAISQRILAEGDLADVPVDSLTLLFHSSQAELSSDASWAVERHLPRRLPEMNDQDAALFLSSVGTSRSSSQRPKQLEALHSSLTAAPSLTGPALAQLAQAFARLRSRDEAVLKRLGDLVIAKVRQMPPQSMGMVANAYARMSFLEGTLLNSLGGAAARDLAQKGEQWDHIAVTQLLNAQAKVRFFQADFFREALNWLSVPEKLQSCSPQSLAVAMNAYGKFVPESKQAGLLARVEAWFLQAAHEVVARAEDYQVQNLVNVLAAFAQLSIKEPALLGKAVAVLVQRKHLWNSQDIANLASALARLEYWDVGAFTALAESAKQCTELGEAASLLNSLAHFLKQGQQPDASAVVEAAFDSVHLSDESLARGDIFQMALLLNSLTKTRPTSSVLATLVQGLEARCHPRFVPEPAVVSLALGAFARLLCQPPLGLQEAVRKAAAAKARSPMALTNCVGLLSALVRLDGVRSPMRPWFRPLLDTLAALLAPPSPGWNARSLPTALATLCMLPSHGESQAASPWDGLWWRVGTPLWQLASEYFRRHPPRPDSIEARQLLQALLLLFHLRLLPGVRASRHPSSRLLRALAALPPLSLHLPPREEGRGGSANDAAEVGEHLVLFGVPIEADTTVLHLFGIDIMLLNA